MAVSSRHNRILSRQLPQYPITTATATPNPNMQKQVNFTVTQAGSMLNITYDGGPDAADLQSIDILITNHDGTQITRTFDKPVVNKTYSFTYRGTANAARVNIIGTFQDGYQQTGTVAARERMMTTISRSNVVVTVRIKVRPRSVNKMRVIANDLIAASRGENGCIHYIITEAQDDETDFFIYMVWRDEESYKKHAESPYVRAFEHEIAREILEKRVVTEKWHSLG